MLRPLAPLAPQAVSAKTSSANGASTRPAGVSPRGPAPTATAQSNVGKCELLYTQGQPGRLSLSGPGAGEPSSRQGSQKIHIYAPSALCARLCCAKDGRCRPSAPGLLGLTIGRQWAAPLIRTTGLETPQSCLVHERSAMDRGMHRPWPHGSLFGECAPNAPGRVYVASAARVPPHDRRKSVANATDGSSRPGHATLCRRQQTLPAGGFPAPTLPTPHPPRTRRSTPGAAGRRACCAVPETRRSGRSGACPRAG